MTNYTAVIAKIACLQKVSSFDKNTSMMRLLAKKVTDTQKSPTLDREDRKNNVLIFMSLRDIKEDDNKIFNQKCSQSIGFVDILKVSMTRLEVKNSDHQKPFEVSFPERWEKHKFFAKLYKLEKKFQHIKRVKMIS